MRTRTRITTVVALLMPAVALAVLPVSGAAATSSAVTAPNLCFDPVPEPLQAGWSHEGDGTFQPGARLIVIDPGLGANHFKTFRCADPTMFQGDVVLTPRLTVDAGFTAASDGNLGIHVTINDGAYQFRAVLFREGVGSLRVRVALPGDSFSSGFAFFGLQADFSMTRTAAGSMVLSVANPAGGQPLQETFNLGDVPQTTVQNLEFGTYNLPSASTTTWETLGLPKFEEPDQITGLIALIESFNLRSGIENSFDVKLRGVQEALAAANAGDVTTACNKLDAFLNEVAAQSGKALTASEAGQLAAAATEIKAVLGCS
jgi:hypothetical protein